MRTLDSLRPRLARAGGIFPRNAALDHVETRTYVAAKPDEVWQRLMFFEEVPHRPPLLLRLLLPVPLSTSKAGVRAGESVECTYSRGARIVKRFTEVSPPFLVCFDVVEQHLGIEPCLMTVSGSYRIRSFGAGSEIALTTTYRGHLRPRGLWRIPERRFAHEVHRHILRGMGASEFA